MRATRFHMMCVATANRAGGATDGTAVEYLFRDLDNIHLNSTWKSFLVGQKPQWSVSGLEPGENGQPREYRYEVKARNLGNGLETEWSTWAAVYPISSYFTPAYAEWETEPNLTAGIISMKAREVTDSCGRLWLGDEGANLDPLAIRRDITGGTNVIPNW